MLSPHNEEISGTRTTPETTPTVFRNAAAEFVYIRTYSRWIQELGRRECWAETVDRYIDFVKKHRGKIIPAKVLKKIQQKMLGFAVMPSMRALWAAGEAAEVDNTVLYNCSFSSVDSPESFSECLYVLMCGTGYGFSVSKDDVAKLPPVPVLNPIGEGSYVVPDSRIGWADSVKELVQALFRGHNLQMDYSQLRPKGARLRVMGGRSSGPEPLILLHSFVREVFQKAQGRQLTTLEAHDICNQIAEVVVVGGVRRSSQISLSDLGDEEMRNAKVWPFPLRRAMANNSAVYTEKPTAAEFLKEWAALATSGTGERGIFNLDGARKRSPKRRKVELIQGTNPCCEILLRSKEFCNLSEVIIRPEDDLDDLLEKVETAVWMGVIQSTFTHFPYLSKQWKKNCEEERLLGVSITGQMDNPDLMTPICLAAMKKKALKVAKHASEIMEINMPVAVTCGKPSGTVSQLVDCASGMHARYAKFYTRRYRISATDPLLRMLQAQNVPVSPENGQRKADWERAEKGSLDVCSIYRKGEKWTEDKVTTWVVSFPVKSPDNCVTRHDLTAIHQLEHYKKIQSQWCEHNQSATIYVKDHEWFEVGNWVYQNWDYIAGVSFLPFDSGHYEQPPYEEITEAKYNETLKKTPKIDYSQLGKYELEDATTGSQELACSGDKCELN